LTETLDGKDDFDLDNPIWQILIILLLLIANGLFAMAEIAVVSARKARLQQLANEGSAKAAAAMKIANAPDTFLSTIQIGITLIGIMAGAYGVAHVALASDPMHALLMGQLACSYVLISRAIALPSTSARTAWISSVAMIPLILATFTVLRNPGVTGPTPDGGYIDMITWSIAAVIMAVITSRVIFGLRAEVSKIRQLGQYTLEEQIGEGGMGVVYRARHALLRRPTAIKLLAPEKAGEDNLQRFEREVQLTANLSHPNTVAIFDYGRTPDGVFYYAMEFLDGINLEDLVHRDGALAPGRPGRRPSPGGARGRGTRRGRLALGPSAHPLRPGPRPRRVAPRPGRGPRLLLQAPRGGRRGRRDGDARRRPLRHRRPARRRRERAGGLRPPGAL